MFSNMLPRTNNHPGTIELERLLGASDFEPGTDEYVNDNPFAGGQ